MKTLIKYTLYFIKSIFDGYWEERLNEINHEFKITQNRFEGERFSGSDISFLFPATENKMQISGNWFPKMQIPKMDKIQEVRAYGILYNYFLKEFNRNSWEEKHNYIPKKIIYPVKNK